MTCNRGHTDSGSSKRRRSPNLRWLPVGRKLHKKMKKLPLLSSARDLIQKDSQPWLVRSSSRKCKRRLRSLSKTSRIRIDFARSSKKEALSLRKILKVLLSTSLKTQSQRWTRSSQPAAAIQWESQANHLPLTLVERASKWKSRLPWPQYTKPKSRSPLRKNKTKKSNWLLRLTTLMKKKLFLKQTLLPQRRATLSSHPQFKHSNSSRLPKFRASSAKSFNWKVAVTNRKDKNWVTPPTKSQKNKLSKCKSRLTLIKSTCLPG